MLLVVLAGCHSVQADITATRLAEAIAPPRKLLVVERIGRLDATTGPPDPPVFFASFLDRFETLLRQCGVAARFTPIAEPPEQAGAAPAGASVDALAAALRSFGPDAVLDVRETERRFRDGRVAADFFHLDLVDPASRERLWQAEIRFAATRAFDDPDPGQALAAALIGRMRLDRLLPSCPAR